MAAFLVGLFAIVLLFFVAIGGALVGALSGWLVGLLFDETLRLLAHAMGIPAAAPYQLGAMFGFVGAFFRSQLSTSK